jgi:hypothetical protein
MPCKHADNLKVLTALMAICGIDVFPFLIGAVLSLPRQIVSVYLGFALINAPGGSTFPILILMTPKSAEHPW